MPNYTVALLKPEVSTPDAAIDPERIGNLETVELKDGTFVGKAFIEQGSPKKPSWLAGIERIAGRSFNIYSQHPSGVLVLETEKAKFALTWGQGRYILNQDLAVQDFGLKVALNRIDPDQVRSTEARTLDDTSKHTKTQASRLTRFNEFDFDASRAILQSVTGKPRDAALATRITGNWTASISCKDRLTALPDKCRQLYDAYNDKVYKKEFPWLDSLSSVKDLHEIERLNEELVRLINAEELDNMHLAPPEILEWEKVDGFLYHNERRSTVGLHEDLDLRACLKAMGGTSGITWDALAKNRIRLYDQTTPADPKQWPVVKAIVADMEMDGRKFLLNTGRWFEVEADYAKEVDQQISGIPDWQKMPDALSTDSEKAYNTRAAEQTDGWLCLDGKTLKPTGAASEIEVCDILTGNHTFVHVKKRNSSSTLSHLFSQGHVSARTMKSDPRFVRRFRDMVGGFDEAFASALEWDGLPRLDLDVVYGVISHERFASKDRLPFFSKVNLNHADRILRLMGCRTHYAPILLKEG